LRQLAGAILADIFAYADLLAIIYAARLPQSFLPSSYTIFSAPLRQRHSGAQQPFTI